MLANRREAAVDSELWPAVARHARKTSQMSPKKMRRATYSNREAGSPLHSLPAFKGRRMK